MSKGNDVPKAYGSPSVCGELATTRIEIYVTREGHDEPFLDGVMAHCHTHAENLMEVIGWDPGNDVTARRAVLSERNILCGTGWDYAMNRAIEPGGIAHAGDESGTEISTGVTDLLGDDHPVVKTAVEALTFQGWVDIADIPRQRAALLLESWAHRPELTDREVEAILAQFPETAPAPGTEVIDAYELGQAVERRRAETQAEEDLELLERIDRRLRWAKARHAFTVREISAGTGDNWIWTCICGEATIVQFRDDEGDIREQLVAHLKAPAVQR